MPQTTQSASLYSFLLTTLMQFSRSSHRCGVYSCYRIGIDDGPPYFEEYTNVTRPSRPHITQFNRITREDPNAIGMSHIWYNGFTNLPPCPRYEGMHIHHENPPVHLQSTYSPSNPWPDSVQLVLDGLLAKPLEQNYTFVQTVPMDCGPYVPPGIEGGRSYPIGPGVCAKGGPAYNEHAHASAKHDPSDSLPISKLPFGAWKCLLCDKTLRRKYVAVVHFWNKHGGLGFNCEGRCGMTRCTKTFASRDGLGVHLYPVMVACSACGLPMLRKNIRRHKKQYCHAGHRSMGNE